MTIQAFIEKAIEGGWKPFKTVEVDPRGSWDKIDFERYGYSAPQNLDKTLASITIHRLILAPLAWQAVGKVEGWGKKMTMRDGVRRRDIYTVYMHDMIDALAEGKTIEQFLETL